LLRDGSEGGREGVKTVGCWTETRKVFLEQEGELRRRAEETGYLCFSRSIPSVRLHTGQVTLIPEVQRTIAFPPASTMPRSASRGTICLDHDSACAPASSRQEHARCHLKNRPEFQMSRARVMHVDGKGAKQASLKASRPSRPVMCC